MHFIFLQIPYLDKIDCFFKLQTLVVKTDGSNDAQITWLYVFENVLMKTCTRRTEFENIIHSCVGSLAQYIPKALINEFSGFHYKKRVPGHFGPKPFRTGTPWPKSIYLLGLLGPGLLGSFIKLFICGIQWKTNVYLVYFLTSVQDLSTIGTISVKKESFFPYKQIIFYFIWDISAWDTSVHLQNN